MKALSLILTSAFALAILCFAIWLGSRWYGAIEVVQTASVLNSKDDLFVFINHDKAVLTETRFYLLAKQVTSVLSFPEHVSDDLLVVHLKDGKVSKYDLTDFGSGGSSFVYHGDIYWSRGHERGDTGPTKWKWDGSKFSALSEAEASLLDYNHIKDIDEAAKKEGWDEKKFTLGYRDPEVTVRLRNGEVKVYGESVNGRNPRERVVLVQSGNPNAPETLIDIAKGYQAISKEDYLKLKEQKAAGKH